VSSSYLGFDAFCSILEEAKPLGLSAVKLTGGEPLLHPGISDIIDRIRLEGIALTMETNGVLCTSEIAKKIAACRAPFVSVSLDGVDAATHEWVRGVKGCYGAALAGIKNLVGAGIRPQVIMTVMRHNIGQMEAMIELAGSLGAGSVKFNIVQPTERGKKLHDRGETLSIEELVALGERMEARPPEPSNVRVHYGHPPAFRRLGRMFGETGCGCGICGIKGILGVLADGSYALCGIGESIPELVFGNVRRDRLVDVWSKTPVIRELQDGLPGKLEGICSACLMKDICLGSCIAQNYYRSTNLWSPFWYCEEAFKKNLFPSSRLNENI
jgi:SynChlorMet cassette radical SAM/SPASM protein ScmF